MLVFNRVSMLLRMIMVYDGIKQILIYVDDYLIVGSTETECLRDMHTALRICDELKLQLSRKATKLIYPTQNIKLTWGCG